MKAIIGPLVGAFRGGGRGAGAPGNRQTRRMGGQHALALLTSVLVPLIALTWLCCLAYCFVKSLSGKLEGRQQSTAVTVVVAPSAAAAAPNLFTRSRPPSTRVDNTYAPVTSHLTSSMTLSDFMKAGNLDLNDSLGPRYYPPEPVSRAAHTVEERTALDQMFPSPMAPLEPPWPHLPPIEGHRPKPSSSFSTRVNQLSTQILNLPSQGVQGGQGGQDGQGGH